MLLLKKLRLDMGISQQCISSKIKISDRAYKDIENGKSCPSLNTIKKSEAFYKKPYKELLKEV